VSLNEKTFQTFSASKPMSALPPKTGFRATHRHVRLGPKPEVAVPIRSRGLHAPETMGRSSAQADSPSSSALPAAVPRGQCRVFCGRIEPWPHKAHGGIGVGRGDCERVAISRAISCLIFAD